ncbi:BatD family protein [Flavobacterium sp. NRK1]|nr:BatD family protein [Flavobacterium sp. NRK1]MCO6147563.1 BatD family protein [Flavobacterium sp. NRK1]
MIRTKLYTILFLLAAVTVFGQQKQVQASIDSTKIRIGSQFNLTLKTKVDTSASVNFPEGKNFGRLEVLESYPVDTIRDGGRYELVKKYGLTQFDSGRYVIPSLPVFINNKGVKTDSLLVEVRTIKVDTLKQKMFDIKPVLKAKANNTFWFWLLFILAFVGSTAFGLRYYLKRRKPREPKAAKEELITPIEKATRELQNLEKKELLAKGQVKDYYSQLTDIARVYIEEAIHVPAMESTTSELIEAMRAAVLKKRMSLTQETFEELEKILRTADMVKFAKSRPLDFEIAEDRNRIEKTIVVIDRSIPEEKEEDDIHTQLWLEAQRKKKAKKKRNLIIAGIAFVVSFVIVFSITTFGMDYLRDNFLGHPTKELLEGEWVKSEYGNPSVFIETPKVLKRRDVSGMIPPDAKAKIKNMAMFEYGAMFEKFYIAVSTTTFKEETDIDLNVALEGGIKSLEAQGATNILVKNEEFNTDKGITGMRAYGNMTLKDPLTAKPIRAYYEVLLFKQAHGLQQVMIVHQEGDEYAMQILERVKNSVELRVN